VTQSSSTADAVVDTNVLRYFSFVERTDLLLILLGDPIGVPRTVFDPDEPGGVPEDAMSEVRRSISVQQRRSHDPTRDAISRSEAAHKARALDTIVDLQYRGNIETLDMTSDERLIFSNLTSTAHAPTFGLKVGLGMGEAACVSIASTRGLVIATDDNDVLTAYRTITKSGRRTRARKLLRDAADAGHITSDEANGLHQEMRRLGFWDTTDPFPARG
jgi:hypothetical protein